MTVMFLMERVIATVAPHSCLNCGREGTLICSWCAPDVCPPLPSRCYRCKAMTANSLTCTKCRHVSRLKHVWVRTSYDDIAKQLIHVFKFEATRAAAPIIASYIHESVPFLEQTIIVPVPTATSRVRRRGYDHAYLVARALSRQTGLPMMRALGRLGQTRQVGTKRAERLTQLRDAFVLNRPTQVVNQSILLIDDVVTTGSSLEAAARTLRAAGAKTVDAAVFAQKQ